MFEFDKKLENKYNIDNIGPYPRLHPYPGTQLPHPRIQNYCRNCTSRPTSLYCDPSLYAARRWPLPLAALALIGCAASRQRRSRSCPSPRAAAGSPPRLTPPLFFVDFG